MSTGSNRDNTICNIWVTKYSCKNQLGDIFILNMVSSHIVLVNHIYYKFCYHQFYFIEMLPIYP